MKKDLSYCKGLVKEFRWCSGKRYVLLNRAEEIYAYAEFLTEEVKRLRKTLVENGLAHYDSSGEFVEKPPADPVRCKMCGHEADDKPKGSYDILLFKKNGWDTHGFIVDGVCRACKKIYRVPHKPPSPPM
jgi:hypothetical protein